MFKRPAFILKYWLCWILFFEFARIVFLFVNYDQVKLTGNIESFRSMWYGLRMDMSMATYITLPVGIFVILSIFFQPFRLAIFYKIYTALVLLLVLVALVADLGLFQAWGTRLDATPLKYLSNPKEIWASISHLPVFKILVIFVVIYVLLLLCSKKLLNRGVGGLKYDNKKWLSLALLLLMIGLFIIPLRGGLQLAPLNQSSVYFSQDNFANMAAINAPWNFLYALNHDTDEDTNPFQILEDETASAVVDSLFDSGGHSMPLLDLQKTPSPNIIIIAWESFTSKAIGIKKEGITITPGFDSLRKEGIYFSNIYASGDRTDKGIVAILSGYPSQPTTSIIKIPSKAAKLPMLSKVFSDSGYYTSFHYGGELEFANMKAYLMQGSFDEFVSVSDFNKKDQNSKWGAHDGVVMQRFLGDISSYRKPFFSVWLTLSSHEPYEIPSVPVLKGKEDVSQFLSSVHYTDSVIFRFIRESKNQAWWSNTVVVIVADHGHRLLSTGKKSDDFKIPLLFLGGALTNKGLEFNKLGSQTDLAATLLNSLGYSSHKFDWSKNLLDTATRQWSYYSFNNGYGYLEMDRSFVFDNVGKLIVEQEGDISERELRRGKAIQQLTYQDYLEK